jgi:predicted outer membrane repeat protein
MIQQKRDLSNEHKGGHLGHPRRLTSTKCVTTSSALQQAVKNAKRASSVSPTRITICTRKIKVSKYSRRLTENPDRRLAANASGIDISDKNIIFDCILPSPTARCTLDGGGVTRIFYGTSSKVTFDKIGFVNGNVTRDDYNGSGGAVMLMNSTVRIQQCRFARNYAKNGGALAIQSSELFMDNSEVVVGLQSNYSILRTVFTSNAASTSGGAIDMREVTKSNIKDVLFRQNKARRLVRTNVFPFSLSEHYS